MVTHTTLMIDLLLALGTLARVRVGGRCCARILIAAVALIAAVPLLASSSPPRSDLVQTIQEWASNPDDLVVLSASGTPSTIRDPQGRVIAKSLGEMASVLDNSDDKEFVDAANVLLDFAGVQLKKDGIGNFAIGLACISVVQLELLQRVVEADANRAQLAPLAARLKVISPDIQQFLVWASDVQQKEMPENLKQELIGSELSRRGRAIAIMGFVDEHLRYESPEEVMLAVLRDIERSLSQHLKNPRLPDLMVIMLRMEHDAALALELVKAPAGKVSSDDLTWAVDEKEWRLLTARHSSFADRDLTVGDLRYLVQRLSRERSADYYLKLDVESTADFAPDTDTESKRSPDNE